MKAIILSALFLSAKIITAQDVITKIDSSKLQTVILEVNPTEIKCKLFNYSEGPLMHILKTQIAYITYKNGMIEHYTSPVINTKPMSLKSGNYYNNELFDFLTPEEKDARCEKLYKYKNYVGFNHMAFLNNCLGFNYMRDIKQLNLIINVPISIGYDKPVITNGLYKKNYIETSDNFNYNRLNFQFGLSALFTPNMKREVNFLVGPSFLFTSYNVSTELKYTAPGIGSQVFKNDFEIYRKNYGINVGFMQRFNERFNMTMLVTLGYKIDNYNEKDPYGIDFINSISPSTSRYYKTNQTDNVYANYMWTIGYRF